MTEPQAQHPIIERTLEKVRLVHLLRARETLLEIAALIITREDVAQLKKSFPDDADHFFDNFADVPSHPNVKVLDLTFYGSDRDIPWGKIARATAVYGASTDDRAETLDSQPGQDDEDNDEYDPEDDVTYLEAGCWLMSPNLALIAQLQMGRHCDEDNDASADFEIIHSDDRRAMRMYLESRVSKYPDQIEEASAALNQVLGAESASPAPSNTSSARRP